MNSKNLFLSLTLLILLVLVLFFKKNENFQDVNMEDIYKLLDEKNKINEGNFETIKKYSNAQDKIDNMFEKVELIKSLSLEKEEQQQMNEDKNEYLVLKCSPNSADSVSQSDIVDENENAVRKILSQLHSDLKKLESDYQLN